MAKKFGVEIDMVGKKILNLLTPSLSSDAANKFYVDDQDLLKVDKAGDTLTGALTFTGASPQINLSNATSNYLAWNTSGLADPSFTTRSLGTKLLLYPQISASSADFAVGISTDTLWFSVPETTDRFDWYGGTTLAATLTGAGDLTTTGTATVSNLDGTSYDENLRLPPATSGYSSVALGSNAALLTGTQAGQWTLVRFPSGLGNIFTIRHNATDVLIATTEGYVGVGASPLSLFYAGQSATNVTNVASLAPASIATLGVPNGGNSVVTNTVTATNGTANSMASVKVNRQTFESANTGVTVTNASTLNVIGAPRLGTNSNFTNSMALYISGQSIAGVAATAVNSYGVFCEGNTGATNNYSAVFNGGNVGIGITAPTGVLSLTNTFTGAPSVAGRTFQVIPGTHTDNTTASTGTTATYNASVLGTTVLAATNTAVTTTTASNFVVSRILAGNNQTINSAYGLHIPGGSVTSGNGVVTNAFSLYVTTPTGATNNGAAGFLGNVVIARNAGAFGPTTAGLTFTSTSPVTLPIQNGMVIANNFTSFADQTTAASTIGSASLLSFGTRNVSTNNAITVTNFDGLTLGSPQAGTNLTITNLSGLRVAPGAVQTGNGVVSNAYGIHVTAPTGAANNYAAFFSGRIGIGTLAPTGLFQINTNATGTPGTSGSHFSQAAVTFTDNATAAAGTATTQNFANIGQNVLAATNTTVTTNNAAQLHIGGAVRAGTNQTITNSFALQIVAGTALATTVTNAYGLHVVAPTGATNNYAAHFTGNVGLGTTAPTGNLSVLGSSNLAPVANFSGGALLIPASFQWLPLATERTVILSGSTGTNSYGNMVIATNATESANNTLGSLSYAQIQNGKTNPDGFSGIKAGISAATEGAGGTIAGFGGRLMFGTRTDNGGYLERMRITSTGFIGIATNTPTGLVSIANNLTGTPTASGNLFQIATGTYTDNATASAGTLSAFNQSVIGATTLTSTNTTVTTSTASNLNLGRMIAGNNETITNAVALNIVTGSVITGTGVVTNSYGLMCAASTGATNNYAAYFNGNSGFGAGITAPVAAISVASGTSAAPSIALGNTTGRGFYALAATTGFGFTGANGSMSFTSASSIALNANEATTTISRPTNDTIALVNSGVETLRASSSNRVYIGGAVNATATLQIAAGSAAANTAPLKFISGALNTSAEVGAVEFLTDKLYHTITTGSSRKEIALFDIEGTAGRIPFETTNGRLTDLASLAYTQNEGLLVSDNIKLTSAGNGLYIKEGTNATVGVASLTAGTVTVPTDKVTANSRIFLTGQTPGGAPGAVNVSARTNGTSFTITSTSNTDTSSVAWFIVEPVP